MSTSLIIMLSISGGAVLLGFFALLTQKIYIDPDTNQPIDISIPLIGKLKTNYPALVFVLGGLFLAWSTYEKSTIETQKWYITGKLKVNPTTDSPNVQSKLVEMGWNNGQILPTPMPISDLVVEKNGIFKFTIDIPKSMSFEEAIQTLQFSGHPYLFGNINLNKVKNNKEKNGKESSIDSQLIGLTKTSREYEFLVNAELPPEPES